MEQMYIAQRAAALDLDTPNEQESSPEAECETPNLETHHQADSKTSDSCSTGSGPGPGPGPTVTGPTLADVCAKIKDGSIRNVIVMTGAGISVAAGIPDFRSPNTGLYDNLQKYNLPEPTAVFGML
jgi:Sir2 family